MGVMTDVLSTDFRVDRRDEVPLGTQIARRLRSLVAERRIGPGERLPSVRALAELAGVNVNTVRAVYQRLESEGLLVSEQGRGTFVRDRSAPSAAGERPSRADLRREIARLEAELVRHPQPPPEARDAPAGAPARGLLTTEELERVRDELRGRLRQLESTRADLLERLSALDELDAGVQREDAPQPQKPRHSTSSLGRVRVRWVGGA